MAPIRHEVNISMEPFLGILQKGRALNDYEYLVQSPGGRVRSPGLVGRGIESPRGKERAMLPLDVGDFINCRYLTVSGISVDGGYAELMIANANAVVTLPDSLNATDAAPLLCAGVTTYNALRNAPLRSGDLVAVQGVGGLGHLGIQFARRMGFRTVATARGSEKAKLAKELGAIAYIDTQTEDPAVALQRMGGAKVILATAASARSMGPLIAGLAPRGRLIVAGASPEPIQMDPAQLIFGARSVEGTLTGTAIYIEDTLAFSVLENVRPMIETVPLERAAEAYAPMMRGEARFHIVLTAGQ